MSTSKNRCSCGELKSLDHRQCLSCLRRAQSDPERFWAKVDKTANCWNWTGTLDTPGYGSFGFRGRAVRASRHAWWLTNGPIPDGLCVLHRCDNRKCVRPDHLFLGTKRDNSDDMIAKGRSRSGEFERLRTHCPRGHAYTPENTRRYSHAKSGKTMRYCRACNRDRTRAYRNSGYYSNAVVASPQRSEEDAK